MPGRLDVLAGTTVIAAPDENHDNRENETNHALYFIRMNECQEFLPPSLLLPSFASLAGRSIDPIPYTLSIERPRVGAHEGQIGKKREE
jgi:hypothetical protein